MNCAKLENMEARYMSLEDKLSDPSVIADQEAWRRFSREHAEMMDIIDTFRRWKKINSQCGEAREILNDRSQEELHGLAAEELKEKEKIRDHLEQEIHLLLIPRDPNDKKNVILEIRAGAGGDEAALFVSDLLRMYLRFAEKKGWRTEIAGSSETALGGYKEVTCTIDGLNAYSVLKYESGVHRVQRVPETESSGRIHTSTVTVAVLPEAEEVEVTIRPEDLEIDTYRASGAGGQYVNKTESAIRIVHRPTGLTVTCQDEKSQLKNKEKAMKILRARLYDKARRESHDRVAEERREQVGTGDRSERIRTYNFPQGRVTDHRIGLTLYQLEDFLNGNMDEMVNALMEADQIRKIKEGEAVV